MQLPRPIYMLLAVSYKNDQGKVSESDGNTVVLNY